MRVMARPRAHPGGFRLPLLLVAAVASLAVACGGADRGPGSPAAPSPGSSPAPPSAVAYVMDPEARELLAFTPTPPPALRLSRPRISATPTVWRWILDDSSTPPRHLTGPSSELRGGRDGPTHLR
jgi:hypothetical protein